MEYQSNFSKWVRFSDIWKDNDSKSNGVYVLAHINPRQRKPDFDSTKIVYIGETTKQSLRARLGQFRNSAFYRKNGHSGGWTYSHEYLDNVAIENIPSNLFVSYLPICNDSALAAASIKYIERKLILDYVAKNNKFPVCNKG